MGVAALVTVIYPFDRVLEVVFLEGFLEVASDRFRVSEVQLVFAAFLSS